MRILFSRLSALLLTAPIADGPFCLEHLITNILFRKVHINNILYIKQKKNALWFRLRNVFLYI